MRAGGACSPDDLLADQLERRAGRRGAEREGRRCGSGAGRRRSGHQVEERLLALDVEIERALGDAHGLGDVGHLGAAVAAVDEDVGRDVDQPVETIEGSATGHAARL